MRKLQLAVAIVAMAFGLSFAAEPAPAAAEQKTVTLKVEGMTCDHCSSAINKKLAATKGVVSGQADHKAGTATVTYKPGEASE